DFGAYVDKKGCHNKNFGRTVIWKHFQVGQTLGTMELLQIPFYRLHLLSN
ncbi:hypothetical protein ACJX0J_019962, partial [Zea mays]